MHPRKDAQGGSATGSCKESYEVAIDSAYYLYIDLIDINHNNVEYPK